MQESARERFGRRAFEEKSRGRSRRVAGEDARSRVYALGWEAESEFVRAGVGGERERD